jgi:Amt family ammonium transporter
MGALAVGATVAAVCYAAVAFLKPRFGYDDSLDAFGVHGIGGMWGALATAIFISEVTDAGYGGQIWIQVQSVVFTMIFSCVLTLGILFVLRLVFGNLRVSADDEEQGLDLAEHSEAAYDSMS